MNCKPDVIVTRHAQTTLNRMIEKNNGYSRMEWELDQTLKEITPHGREQALKLGSALRNWIPDIVICSTKQRTEDTLKDITEAAQWDLQVISIKKNAFFDEKASLEFLTDHIPGNTFRALPYADLIRKTQKDLQRLLNFLPLCPGKRIFIISHECRISTLKEIISNEPVRQKVGDVFYPNCALWTPMIQWKGPVKHINS